MDSEKYIKMMETWTETAKSCTQLATAALLLPVFFLREILAVKQDTPLSAHLTGWLIGSWACLGLCIALGLIYQVTAARLIGGAYSGTQERPLFPQAQFRMMLASLFMGIILFLVAAAKG